MTLRWLGALLATALVATGGCGSQPATVRVDQVAPVVVTASVVVIAEGLDAQGGLPSCPTGPRW